MPVHTRNVLHALAWEKGEGQGGGQAKALGGEVTMPRRVTHQASRAHKGRSARTPSDACTKTRREPEAQTLSSAAVAKDSKANAPRRRHQC